MNKKTLAGLGLVLVLGLALSGCQDTKAREENEQLKAHVSQLEKDEGDLGNRVDVLTKENAQLRDEIERLKTKHPAKKTQKSRARRSAKRAAGSQN